MRKDNPNYGPGSISTRAKERLVKLNPAAAKAREAAQAGYKSPDAKAIETRIESEKIPEGNVKRGSLSAALGLKSRR